MKPTTADFLTDTQRRGVELVGRDVCVTAGAGSGKTRVLVERFVYLVVTKKTPIQGILTITFTEKAANEMKQRIADRFEELGLERELQDIEFAYLSTIDGFSARLLREHALEAGVDPEFAVLDEYESRYLQRSVAEVILSEWGASNPEDVNVLLRGLHCQHLEETAVDIMGRIRSTGTALQDVAQLNAGPQEMKVVLDKISACLYGLEEYLKHGSVSEKISANISAVTSALLPIVNTARAAPDSLTVDHVNHVDEVLRQYAKLTVPEPVKGNLRDLREEFFPELRRIFFEREAAGVGRVLRKFLAELSSRYEEEKRFRSALDFCDLTEKTVQLLRTAPHVRQELKEKFEYILVDEFQDTNRLQKSLIDLLRSDENLFVVGDARQSIYGFRDADLEVFLQHREEVARENGVVIRLDSNFRTRPEIIDFINHVFKGVSGGNGQVERSELVAASRFNEKRNPSVELILTKGSSVDEARRLEAATLAGRIHDIVEKKEVRITRSGGPREGTPVSYGDVAVLLRSTADIKLYERALAELSIPFFVTRGRGLYNAREITDLMNFLKVIDNPLDEIKLAAVLRSPFVGVTDECLFWLAHYGKYRNGTGKEMFHTIGQADEIPEIEPHHRDRLVRFAGQLNLFRELRGRLSTGSLMDVIIDKTDFDTRMLALPSGRQKYANIRKVVELARSLEKKGFSGLNEFFRVISDLRFMETRESEAPTDVEKSDVVKLMTIHAAKGLEFPVVALADLNRLRRNRSDDLIFSKKTGLGFRVLNTVTRDPETTCSYSQAVEDQRQKDLEEMGRVFYVALTRAEEHLLLSGALGPGSRGEWIKVLAERLGLPLESMDMPESITFGDNGCKLRIVTDGVKHKTSHAFRKLPAPDRQKILDGKKLELPPGAPQSAEDVLSFLRVKPRIGSGGNYVYSVTEIMSFLLCPRLYYLGHYLGLPSMRADSVEETAVDRREHDEIRRDVLGSIVHAVLERYHPDFTEPQLRQSVLQAFNEELIGEPAQEQVDLVTQWVMGFYSGPVGRAVKDSRKVERELPFVFKHRGNPIRGTIDLLFSPDGSDWHLVDYKSSSVMPKEVQGYEFQMRLYSLAVEAIYGRKPLKATLFFIVPKEAVPVDISSIAMKDLEDKLESFFNAQKGGAFPERKGPHCDWCGYRGYCEKG